jgi:hypothetical protein
VLEAAGLGLKHVREQEMLDDVSGFGEITVEDLHANPSHGSAEQAARSAMQTAAVRGRCRAK